MKPRARKKAPAKKKKATREVSRVVLRLYVAGSSPNSAAAIANLKTLDEGSPVQFELEIVDVLQEPRRALSDGILVTPTLVKLSPSPSCRILGNLRDFQVVLRSLGLVP